MTIKLINYLFMIVLFASKCNGSESEAANDCTFTLDLENNNSIIEVYCSSLDSECTSPDQLKLDGSLKFSSIYIENKNFQYLIEPIFVNYSIKSLILNNDQIRYISNKTFSQINNLKSLSLINNQLTIWSTNVLKIYTNDASTADQVIDSSDIKTFDGLASLNYCTLTFLSLDYNNIKFIADGAFRDMNSLHELQISSNNLESLNENTFDGLVNLQILNLDRNSIQIIHPNTFNRLLNLKSLNLGFNYLDRLDLNANLLLEELKLNNNQFRDCSNLGLNYLNNLQKLNLEMNFLKSITCDMFDNLTSLTDLNLKLNQLQSPGLYMQIFRFTNLETVDLSYLSLSTFDLTNYMMSLKNLRINNNQISKLEISDYDSSSVRSNATFIDASFNRIFSIDDNFFRDLPLLNKILLNNNLIQNISEKWFKGLDNLIYLGLSFNKIELLHSNMFSDLIKLDSLELQSNKIKRIEPNTFVGLVLLTSLDLSNNKLEALENHHFEHLINLKTLGVKFNLILQIESDSFKYQSHLTELDLTGNYLDQFNENQLNSHRNSLTNVYLTDNYIVSVHNSAICEAHNIYLNRNRLKSFDSISECSHAKWIIWLDLSENELEQIVLNSLGNGLQKLILSKNRIRYFHVAQKLTHLLELDLSYNLIENLTKYNFEKLEQLYHLDLSFNPIKFIENNFFQSFYLNVIVLKNITSIFDCEILNENITDIDLSYNQLENFKSYKYLHNVRYLNLSCAELELSSLDYLLSQINTSLISIDLSWHPNLSQKIDLNRIKIAVHLNRIYLQGIELDSLDNILFEFTELNSLDLSWNNIRQIKRTHFQNLHSLNWLILSHNIIEYIEQGSFRWFNYLVELNVDHNRIKSFSIQNTHFLNIIDLSNNELEILISNSSNEVLSDSFSNLYFIDLSFNNLTLIDFRQLLMKNYNLVDLNLNNNKITNITENSFTTLTEMKNLDLSFNQLDDIKKETFSSLRALEKLNLAHNELDDNLNQNVFAFQFQLVYLNMSHNQIEYLNSNLFSSLFNLQSLDLSSNRLKTIQNGLFDSLVQLTYLDVSKNHHILIEDNSLNGLLSIKDLIVSLSQLQENKFNIVKSLKLKNVKHVGEVIYYQSIFIQHERDQVDCVLTLFFINAHLQLNLKTENDFSLFLDNCVNLSLF